MTTGGSLSQEGRDDKLRCRSDKSGDRRRGARPGPGGEDAAARLARAGLAVVAAAAGSPDQPAVLAGAPAGPAGGGVLSMLVLAVHAAVPVQRLREMICAYPAFHRAAGSALDNLAGQDGPYS